VPILVVDDDLVIRELVFEQLSEEGYEVAVAGGSDRALEILMARAFALILSDVWMAPKDGFTLLSEIRDRNMETPIVLMSAVARPGTLERVREAGAAGFLQKPFTQAQLVDVVRATRRG